MQNWFDEFLNWDPAEYDNVERIRVSKDRVWLPDINVFQRYLRILLMVFVNKS